MTNISFSPSSSFFTIFFLILPLFLTCTSYVNGCYTPIISFGDSLADTGNLKELTSQSEYYESINFFSLPYGETFFHEPTGRCSNGRLVIDFVAESLGLPFIPPYLGSKWSGGVTDLGQGVNYAVAGATALNSSFLEARGVPCPSINAFLEVQLEWFKQSLPSICSTASDCRQLIGRSLVLMGEIGGNDYNYQLITGKSIDDIEPYVPFVINIIISAVSELIELGANTIVVPGNLPIGCSATYLSMHYGSNKEEYDNTTGCLIRFNRFVEYHNELLQMELNQIRERHPTVNIIYADYYNAAMQFYRSPSKFGFTNGALKACCGGEGPFNYNPLVTCGGPSSTTCAQPDTYTNWDGLHLTEAAYRVIYKSVFQGLYTIPQFKSLCFTSTLEELEGLLNST